MCALCGLALAAASAALGPIAFEEIADRAGLRFVADSCPTPNKNLPETMLAGVALFDYDNDGYLDVYFVNGAAIPSLKKESPKYWNRLFHNNHDGTFTDVTEKAGVKGEGYGMGVAIGDYDNDGWPDIFLANVTRNQLFHNNHDGTFTDVTDKAGVGGGVLDGRKMWAVAAGWFDYDNDGYLDLFVSNYCKWEVNKDPFCGPNPNLRAYCHPKNYAPLPNTLYHNNGDGTFTDVSAAMGISQIRGKGMGVAFADYDHDGFMDVFVANDNAPNMLFQTWAARNSRRWRYGRESPIRSPALMSRAWAPISGTSTTTATTTSGWPPSRARPFRCSRIAARREISRRSPPPPEWPPSPAPCRAGRMGFSISTTTDGRTYWRCAGTRSTISPR